jgi:hypothetical protein
MSKLFLCSENQNISYGESNSALFLTTPQLFTSITILDPAAAPSADKYCNPTKNIYLNADKIYGHKVIRMSESILSNLFRHAEKVRIKNSVQEKMLNEKLNGHKGIERKLQYVSLLQ